MNGLRQEQCNRTTTVTAGCWRTRLDQAAFWNVEMQRWRCMLQRAEHVLYYNLYARCPGSVWWKAGDIGSGSIGCVWSSKMDTSWTNDRRSTRKKLSSSNPSSSI
jgi:spore coat protein U-like protein